MKKSFLSAKNLFVSVCVLAVLFYVAACNSLNGDPDPSHPAAPAAKEVYVTASGSSIIDLNARIQTTNAVNFSVTRQPSSGSLLALGKGLVQYTPAALNVKSRDVFQFKVYGNDNVTIESDSVVVIVTTDTTQLPCGIYAYSDLAYSGEITAPVFISPLSNDVLCGTDSTDIELTIFKTDTASLPAYGTAVVAGPYIMYKPGLSYPGYDRIIYRIQSKSNPSLSSYATIAIEAKTALPCALVPADDHFSFSYDSISPGDTLRLRIFDNDGLCKNIKSYQFLIAQNFQHGQASAPAPGAYWINYLPEPVAPGTSRSDSLRYQLCIDNNCKQASVFVLLKRP